MSLPALHRLLRLREEYLARVDAVLTVTEAGRRPAAARLYAELSADIRRYQAVLEQDSRCVRLFSMLAVVQEPTEQNQAVLDHARRRWRSLRRSYDLDDAVRQLL